MFSRESELSDILAHISQEDCYSMAQTVNDNIIKRSNAETDHSRSAMIAPASQPATPTLKQSNFAAAVMAAAPGSPIDIVGIGVGGEGSRKVWHGGCVETEEK